MSLQSKFPFKLDLTEVRPEEISTLVRHSCLSAAVNASNAILFVLGTINWSAPWPDLIWLTVSLSLFTWIGFRSYKAKNIKAKRVSPKTIRRTTLFAILTASPWAVLPFTLSNNPSATGMAISICAAMSAGGAFVMHPVPIAAIAYFSTIIIAVIVEICLRDFASYWPIILYTLSFWMFLFVMTMSSWRTARERENNLKRAASALEDLEQVNVALEALRTAAEFDALHDPLTSLGNRRSLEYELQRRISVPDDKQYGIAVFHIDLDRFKEINDTLGHAAGDLVLTHVAKTLMRETDPDDFVARIGGDEFVILRSSDGSRAILASVAQKIIRKLSEPISYHGDTCSFGASIGIDVGFISNEAPENSPERMLSNADMALYQAKERGRGRFEFYRSSFRKKIEENKRLQDQLTLAFSRGEFVPVFQPQIDAKTGQICGVEALARWRHPERGLLLPMTFMPVAERLGVSHEIDRRILVESVRAVSRWDSEDVRIPRLAVNVSAMRLRDTTLISELSELEISPSRLSIEVLESVFVDHIDDEMRQTLDRFNEMGIEVEIDDFGTGHASLLSLLTLKPRRLKVARELAAPVALSPTHRNLVKSIVEIANSLQIEITAEGVETKEQASVLTNLGCHRLQGYYFAKPMFFQEFQDFLLHNKTGSMPLSA